eukprot:10257210-Alexandrium_andersonii.AAC.1
MSASLVGSEMCIRDRFEGGGARGKPCRGRPVATRGSALGHLGAQKRPVSYTHLTLPTICSV